MIAAPGQPEQICPECDHVMRLVHKGRFSTLYVCPTCACTFHSRPQSRPFRRRVPSADPIVVRRARRVAPV
jgi:hypothetical protein